MNVLFLSNPARGYHKFFNSLALKFQEEGHAVVVAADCHYSAYINRLSDLGLPFEIFSEYFANHTRDPDLLGQYAAYNLNAALLPDYERGQVFDFLRRRDKSYYDNLKSALLSFFSNVIESNGIDLVIFENVAGAFAHMAWFVCRKNGIRYAGITSARLPGRFAVTDGPFEEHRPIEAMLAKIQSSPQAVCDKTWQWCANYLEHLDTIEPDYMKFNNLDKVDLISGLPLTEKVRVWFAAFRFMFADHEYAFGIGNPAYRKWVVFCRAVARRLRVQRINRYYSAAVPGERYLLYPLHYHPEASTSVLAGTYLNEYEVIRNIAFNLPEGVRLYVKDHMSAFGVPGNEFYEAIVRLPNVRLLQPFAQTKQLIRDSVAVVTLTSTVGYEALLLGKRVFLFGSVFYQGHPDVVRVTDPAAIFSLLQEWLDKPLRADRAFNLRYVAAYYLSTFPGVLNLSGPGAPDLARSIYPYLLQALGRPDRDSMATA